MKSLVFALAIAILGLQQAFTPVLAATPALAAAPLTVNAASTCGTTYIVQRGDYLSKIAKNCGVTTSFLIAVNPEIKNPSLIYPGQVIRITSDTSIPVTGGTYTVVRGDTLYKISVRFGTTVDTLLKLNPGITNRSLIYAGQIIRLPATSSVTPLVSLSTRSAKAGGAITVTVLGFPANAEIDYRVGKQGAAYSAVVDGKTDAYGSASAAVTIPSTAKVGETWVVTVLTTSLATGTSVTSSTITIIQ